MNVTKLAVIMEKTLYILTLMLAFMLPFAVLRPIVFLLTFDFTNVEIIIILSGIVGLFHLTLLIFNGELSKVIALMRGHLITIACAFAFLVSALISALIAPTNNTEALTYVFRIATGIYVFLLTLYVANTRERIVRLAQIIAFGAGLSALIGLGEIASVPGLDEALLLFKEAPSQVGGVIRLSSTFQYTTIASAYYEMAIPLALILVIVSRHKFSRLAFLVFMFICTVAVIFTLTRSGMATVFIIGMIYLSLALWRFRQLLLPSMLLLITLLGVLGVLSLNVTGVFIARMTTEDDTHWYGADYQVPTNLTIESGMTTIIPVKITNTGKVTWQISGENPYKLGFYWISQIDNKPLDRQHQEVNLPSNVAPGDSTTIDVEVNAQLPVGDYVLRWGMLQSDILWFRHRDVPEESTIVQIQTSTSSDDVEATVTTRETPPGGEIGEGLSATVSRLDLWRAAFMMWQERPLFGVGPDNFRLLYGQYLGYDSWYLGNHANNLYLELLATTGLIGFLAFISFVLTLAHSFWKQYRRLKPSSNLLVLGLGGSLLAFFVHGMLDYFLPFLPTLGLFWMSAGLLIALNANTDPAMLASHDAENGDLAHSDKLAD